MTTEQRWYHGTRAAFGVGGYLFPQAWHGGAERAGHVGVGSTEYIYMTDDIDLAWWYATNTKGRGKPKVLVLRPGGPVEHDPSRYDGEEDQYRSRDIARVVEVLKER